MSKIKLGHYRQVRMIVPSAEKVARTEIFNPDVGKAFARLNALRKVQRRRSKVKKQHQ